MDEAERKRKIASLRRNLETTKVEKRRLLSLLSTTELTEKQRRELGEVLDETLEKFRKISDELFTLTDGAK